MKLEIIRKVPTLLKNGVWTEFLSRKKNGVSIRLLHFQ
mgnify:CR=1 FL=1